MADDESTLLSRVAARDADALRMLLERHGGAVWSAIQGDIAPQWRGMIEADDVMQVTYMEAFLRMDQLAARDAAGFVAWLRRIAQNNLRDAIKELQRKKRPPPAKRVQAGAGDASYLSLVELLGATHSTPSRQVAREEAAQVIDAMLERLPPDYAKVIRLYDLEGLEIAAVGDRLGRRPGAVHMLRARAHERLRTLLGAETDFFTHTA